MAAFLIKALLRSYLKHCLACKAKNVYYLALSRKRLPALSLFDSQPLSSSEVIYLIVYFMCTALACKLHESRGPSCFVHLCIPSS